MTGAQCVQATWVAMQEIVTGIARLSHVFAQIDVTMNEQSADIGQIDQQAHALSNIVGRFRLSAAAE